jgi:hypothetical protein
MEHVIYILLYQEQIANHFLPHGKHLFKWSEAKRDGTQLCNDMRMRLED